jgi:hypothetical protein
MLKYPPGTKLKYIGNQKGAPEFGIGKVYTICKSKRYNDAYAFVELLDDYNLERTDPGWCIDFVEDPKEFELAKVDKWKQVITNG